MTSASINPRRRPARVNDSALASSLIDSFQNMSIRKGDTFHPQSAAGKTDFWDPLEEAQSRSPLVPLRSTTSPKSLEDLLIGAGERRVAHLLNRVDKAVAAKSKVALGNVLSEPEVLPVPSFMLHDVSVNESVHKPRTRHHSHSSDSGIGSSIADSTESASATERPTRTAVPTSAVSRSFSGISTNDQERGLSKYAAEQIHKYIVKPILREQALCDFHDLIKSVPSRIGDKEIKNLRDLEKTLIFLAPDYSLSPSKYLAFCERTIRVLHTTVTTLHESDQRAPADRPYTQGYFYDLVEQVRLGNLDPVDSAVINTLWQIRRYAAILAATREKQASGEQLDEMDSTPDEKVSIHGGVARNGKPAELVRHTADGKVVSIATGLPISEEELASASSMKRPSDALDVDEDDDALRSMARRKKNAKPEIHTCDMCSKEFKRPCDLTKHVKTHERPFKCPKEDCKYHALGWPTEKERDRHVNDKHSSAPSLFHCLYKPCPYTSKRESNCKQHMEKAHNWTYVRSKNNGKGRASSVTRLHQGSIPPSPSSAMLTPHTPIAPSPSNQSWSESSRRGSMPPPPTAGPSNYGTPAFTMPSPDFANHFNFNFNDMSTFASGLPITPAMSEESRDSTAFSSNSGLQFDGSSFNDASPQDLNFENFDYGEFDYDDYPPNSFAGPSSGVAADGSHAMPLAQTFTSPTLYDAMNLDEGCSAPGADFTLFGAAAPSATSAGDMFPSLTTDASWGALDSMGTNFGSHSDGNQPSLPTGNSVINDLFPELDNH